MRRVPIAGCRSGVVAFTAELFSFLMKVFLLERRGLLGVMWRALMPWLGAELRLLTRSTSNLKLLEGVGGERVVGDLREPEALRTALRGCDALVHVAADYRLWVRIRRRCTRPMWRHARAAAACAGRGCREGGVHVVAWRRWASGRMERLWMSLRRCAIDDMIGHYKRSKFLAEQEAIAAARTGQHVMILNPTTPIGPGDVKPTPTGRIVVDFLNRKFPAYVDTGLNLVDVAEVARAHVRALECGRPGERYILGGENLTLKQILDRMSAITGLPSPTMKVPHAVAMAFAFFDEMITGEASRQGAAGDGGGGADGAEVMFASSAKAERELGFKVLPIYHALRGAIDWFVANGYAPAPAGSQ